MKECAFALTEMGWEVVVLETAVVMALMRVATRAVRTVGYMLSIVFASLSLSSLSCLLLVMLLLILSAL